MKKLLFMAIAAVTLMAGDCTPQEAPFPQPEMVSVTGGPFLMGSTVATDPPEEQPAHIVTLDSYSIGKYQVTQKEWESVMGAAANISATKGAYLPVTNVSWNDIVGTSTGSTKSEVIKGITYYDNGFIYQLNQKTKKKYRLPTESEWEYAARGGHKATNPNYTHSGSNTPSEVAWTWENSGGKVQAVGTKKANDLGVFDMSGNVWEWCSDWYSSTYYTSSAVTNPTGPGTGSIRVMRGGSWFNTATWARVSFRSFYNPSIGNYHYGFRLAL